MCGGGAAGLAGGAGLDLGQSVVLRDEDGDDDSKHDGARPEQEGRTGDDGLLQRDRDVSFILTCLFLQVYTHSEPCSPQCSVFLPLAPCRSAPH